MDSYDDLDGIAVSASLEGFSLRFGDAAQAETALALFRRFSSELTSENVLSQPDGATFSFPDESVLLHAIDELESFDAVVRFPKEERLAWIASLDAEPWAGDLYRGERPIRSTGYASDPGDLGTGRYFSSHWETAANYGPVAGHRVEFGSAVKLGPDLVSKRLMLFYRTTRGLDRVGGADTMRSDFLESGIEGLVVDGYDSPKGHVTVVDFRSEPPRPLKIWDVEEASAPSP